MAKVQSRKSFSVRGVTYAAVRLDCADRDLSMSDYIEALIEADRQARGLTAIVAPVRSPVAEAVAAVQREGERQVEQVVEAVLAVPLPAESKITAGPPPEQTAMLGREETPRRSQTCRCPCCGNATLRREVRCGACAINCAKREDGTWEPGKMCPLRRRAPAWVEPMKPAPSCARNPRPTHGDRVAPPAPGRGPGNVVSF